MTQNRQDHERHERISRYLGGGMSDAEIRQIEADAAMDDELATEIALRRSLAGAVMAEPASQAASDGWARLQAAMRASDRDATQTPEPRHSADIVTLPRHIPEQPVAANDAPRPKRFAQFAAAGLAVVALGQAGYIASNANSAETAPAIYETVSEVPSANTIQIAFAATATEGEMRELLLSLDATLADGPSALGLYELRLADAANCAEASARLRDTAIIERAGTCR